jgi:hypothetical protein
LIDPKNPNPRPHADGVVGFFSHAYMGQLVEQMGHMSISSHPSTSCCNAQNEIVPTHTFEVNSMKSMQLNNPQQHGGKKKGNKKKNSNTE